MATVRFYGDLQRYGRKFKLNVFTAGEALKALTLQIPGLRQHIQQGHYRVRIAGKDLKEETVHQGMQDFLPKDAVIHIVPHAAGAKNGGILPVIMGIAMIAAAYWTGGASLAEWGTMQTALFSTGVSMLVSGVISMLTKMPEIKPEEGDTQKNTSFSNLDNALTQGRPVALCYGEMMIGSQVLSQGITTV